MKKTIEARLEKLEQVADMAAAAIKTIKVLMATAEEWELFYEAHPEELKKNELNKNGWITGLNIHFVTPEGQTPSELRPLPELEMYFKNGGTL